jgi:predicted dehydrogenase
VKILVVGTGSIGKRHIVNLQAIGVDVSAYSYRSMPWDTDLGNAPEFITTLDQKAVSKYDSIVVANRTDMHIQVASLAAIQGRGIFIEKPLSCSLQGVGRLLEETRQNNCIVESGFMMRLHPNLIWLRDLMSSGELGDVVFAQASVGQHLADWRPYTDYRNSYSAKIDQGGGVIFDLIHELDIARWLFGEIDAVSAVTRKTPSLDIETEAVAEITLLSECGATIHIHLDYVSPQYQRHLRIVGTRGIALWDYISGTVKTCFDKSDFITAHSTPISFNRNSMFLAHMRHFLARHLDKNLATISSIEDSVAALKIAIAAHLSARERAWIRPDALQIGSQSEVIN